MSFTPAQIAQNITRLTSKCIELSLCNGQNYPCVNSIGSSTDVSFPGKEHMSLALRNTPYKELYDSLLAENAFNMRMVDGALLQLSYRFQGEELISHRLAFFPSPDLAEFQNSPEVYELEELYAEIILKNIVPFPIRFDFDSDSSVYDELHHPYSHLTLGQYANCRIPVSGPLTPSAFLDFILRSFYNTTHRRYCEELPLAKGRFEETISVREQGVVHIRIPA